ncbi:MAG: DUF4267 domain-containing protein, partial [Pseudomonadota bacterium]
MIVSAKVRQRTTGSDNGGLKCQCPVQSINDPQDSMAGTPDSTTPEIKNKARRVVVLTVMAGAILTIIGVRFWLFPYSATMTFGLNPEQPGSGYERMISLRDIWLGLLAIAFAVFREWRALCLWFALGAIVCWVDATLVIDAEGPAYAIGFHIASGVFCLALAVSSWQLYKREQR